MQHPNPQGHTHIVIGRFEKHGKELVEVEGELVYPLGQAQFTWNRMVAVDGCNRYKEIEHCHYNGAKQAKYDGEFFEWYEFGPAHSQAEIDEILATQEVKEERFKKVGWDNKSAFKEGHDDFGVYYLKITGYTSDVPEPLVCPPVPEK